jgi:sulfur relay (sulfurtransferase) complex TusBCD TusD component (DsrE family)
MSDHHTVLLVTRNGLGQADQELQHILAGKYFQLIAENSMFPTAICFYADGVKLVCEGSPVLDQLQRLQEKGVFLIVCKTCLDYLGLADRMRVGIIGSMPDIIEAQWQADKVITV